MKIALSDLMGIALKLGLKDGALVYELKIPLSRDESHPYAVNTAAGHTIGLGFETPKMDRSALGGERREGPGGVDGGGSTVTPEKVSVVAAGAKEAVAAGVAAVAGAAAERAVARKGEKVANGEGGGQCNCRPETSMSGSRFKWRAVAARSPRRSSASPVGQRAGESAERRWAPASGSVGEGRRQS